MLQIATFLHFKYCIILFMLYYCITVLFITLPDNKTKPTHRRTDANLYSPEGQLTKASGPSFHLEGGAKGQI